jgi:hypothetical protein
VGAGWLVGTLATAAMVAKGEARWCAAMAGGRRPLPNNSSGRMECDNDKSRVQPARVFKLTYLSYIYLRTQL